MTNPVICRDFQLFSPLDSSERRVSQGDSMSVDQTSTDDASQDWTQWMRWDDEQALPKTANASPNSPFDPAFISPGASSGQQAPDAIHKVFSPDISLDFKNPPLGSYPGRNQNNSISPQLGHLGTGPLSGHSNSPFLSTSASRKRKTGSDDDGSVMTSIVFRAKPAPSKKRAHNVIEKRYRANLNEKIAELRDSVPSLRASSKQANGTSGDENDDDDGIAPASKLNKASILSKATEYIRHLEIRNKRLEEENTALKTRLHQLDKAADQVVTSAASVSSPSNCTVSTESGLSSSPSVFSHAEDVPSGHSPTSSYPPEGLIKVPDAWKRMRAAGSNESPYSQSYIQYKKTDSDSAQSGGGRMRSHLPNKYMLGALAGLMVLEGLGTEKKTESTAKGLLAVPLNLLNRVQLPSQVYSSTAFQYFWSFWHARAISHFLLLAILVVGSAFIVFVYLFNSDPRRQYSASKVASDVTLSTCNFRRQAWLTSIQRVGVPRHRFFHEWYVVTSRCFEYVLRCLLGWKLYSLATGVTEEDEKGRVKTWDIAIDAQLAGGDAEISKSRLVLTIFAAGTLPQSPMRMMLKALHCRILLWRVGEPGSWTFNVSNDVARSLARYQWDLARKMNRALPKNHPDALPSHLANLLKIDCDDVMIDTIIQRAANLTWNRPTQEGTDDDEALLDVVEEDPAIQSSLDALSAWWSSHLLQRALLRYFEASSGGPDAKKSRDVFKSKIKLALDVAPQPSAAHTRALVMKAVFFERDRVANIGSVLAALPKDTGKNKQNQASNFLDSSLPVSVREEISTAVRCAMIAAIFTARATGDASLPAAFTVQRAIHWFNSLPLDPVELTLVEFAAIYHLLRILASDIDYLASSDSSAPPSPMSIPSSSDDEAGASQRNNNIIPHPIPNLGRVASELIYWARNAYNPAFYGFTSNLVKVIETECTSLCRTAGVHVADYSCVQEEKSRAKQVLDAKNTKPSAKSRRFAGESEEANPMSAPTSQSDDNADARSSKPGQSGKGSPD
ncbi:hypothetical protein CDV55_103346 [Aspergillus turcosus]|uniref:BHLH domain-containing protein n=1 Tax=Aspergillus turcosus TaxID=1245748 RepID=A0A229YMQ0_9EURO|nr:hypothetical protein CDV55_103346 [Aspergillus turcosus]RLL94707.1 hypothetical protein CFD26_102179 [Aspergillus turcosus]